MTCAVRLGALDGVSGGVSSPEFRTMGRDGGSRISPDVKDARKSVQEDGSEHVLFASSPGDGLAEIG